MQHAFKVLQIKARQQVYTLLSGYSLSKRHGEGYDFSHLREYQAGDEVRKINWAISAKLAKPYIKEVNENRELSIVITALMDGGLYFDTNNDKQIKITEVATLLAYATQYNNDLFMGAIYTQDNSTIIPPTKQIYAIESFSKTLWETPLLNTELNYKSAIDSLFIEVHKPSLIFIIGDFLEGTDLSLLAQKHEVIAIIIRHKEEENPKVLNEVNLFNPKNNRQKDTYVNQNSVQYYQDKYQEHDKKLKAHFAQHNIRSVKIFTEDEAVEKLVSLFI